MNAVVELKQSVAAWWAVSTHGREKFSWRSVKIRVYFDTSFRAGERWVVEAVHPYCADDPICAGHTRRSAIASGIAICRKMAQDYPEFRQLMHDAHERRCAEYRALGIDPDKLRMMPLFGPIDPEDPEGLKQWMADD